MIWVVALGVVQGVTLSQPLPAQHPGRVKLLLSLGQVLESMLRLTGGEESTGSSLLLKVTSRWRQSISTLQPWAGSNLVAGPRTWMSPRARNSPGHTTTTWPRGGDELVKAAVTRQDRFLETCTSLRQRVTSCVFDSEPRGPQPVERRLQTFTS